MKDLTFGGIKVHIPHLFPFSRLSRSFWRTWLSMCELRARYIAVSSEKSLTHDLTCSGRSLMYPGRFGPIPVRSSRFGPGRFGPISGVSRFGPVGAGRFGPNS